MDCGPEGERSIGFFLFCQEPAPVSFPQWLFSLLTVKLQCLAGDFTKMVKKKKQQKQNEPMETAQLFRQHCSKGFYGQGTFRRLEEKNQDTFYQVLFSKPEFKGKALGTKNCAVIN